MSNEEIKTEIISQKLLALNAVMVGLVVVMVFAIYGQMNRSTKQVAEVREAVTSNAFDNLQLEGRSAYVFDIQQNKVLFKKNEFVQLPLASLTKLMTALVATEMYPSDLHVTIKKEFLSTEGDSGLLVGETWKLKDLLDFSLVVSSNDGIRAVASIKSREDFISKMNARAKELGLKQTYFVNENGLDDGESSGGYGSAIDVEKMMQYILENQPEIIEATKYQTINIKSGSKIHTAKNTDIVLNQIPNLIASKTGYTDMAGGNLVVAFDASIGRPIIVVVLGSSEQGRFSDVEKLVGASLEYISE